MNEVAIRVQGIGKQYRLGAVRERYSTLRDQVLRWTSPKHWLRPRPTSAFWALKDVSFEVNRGDVVGIIGRNGAGKSTLLKILSRITEPTEGEADIHGRVGSLLEVGTGFHPELTGRENIYLNGAILGMKRAEITRKFDEIVAFAEVERFIDTPVKHYSSGMFMRLAFAVAAHLEPEVLVVDEVLAVGDAEFQKKCLGKMGDVARAGRTVLFVSHNLSSVQTLCERVIRLHAGKVVGDGAARDEIAAYLKTLMSSAKTDLESRADRDGDGRMRLTRVMALDGFGNPTEGVDTGDPMELRLEYRSEVAGGTAGAEISIWSAEGIKVFHVDNTIRGVSLPRVEREGVYRCHFPRLCLAPGRYYANALLSLDGEMADHVQCVVEFDVREGDFFRMGRLVTGNGGLVIMDHDWLPPSC